MVGWSRAFAHGLLDRVLSGDLAVERESHMEVTCSVDMSGGCSGILLLSEGHPNVITATCHFQGPWVSF